MYNTRARRYTSASPTPRKWEKEEGEWEKTENKGGCGCSRCKSYKATSGENIERVNRNLHRSYYAITPRVEEMVNNLNEGYQYTPAQIQETLAEATREGRKQRVREDRYKSNLIPNGPEDCPPGTYYRSPYYKYDPIDNSLVYYNATCALLPGENDWVEAIHQLETLIYNATGRRLPANLSAMVLSPIWRENVNSPDRIKVSVNQAYSKYMKNRQEYDKYRNMWVNAIEQVENKLKDEDLKVPINLISKNLSRKINERLKEYEGASEAQKRDLLNQIVDESAEEIATILKQRIAQGWVQPKAKPVSPRSKEEERIYRNNQRERHKKMVEVTKNNLFGGRYTSKYQINREVQERDYGITRGGPELQPRVALRPFKG